MASIINASTSGAGGVITTADASGQLELQTAGVTRQTINASGNVGIGTSSPNAAIEVARTAAVSGFSATGIRLVRSNFGGEINGYINQGVNSGLILSTVDSGTATERMRIDSNGNVLVGTTTSGLTGSGFSVTTYASGRYIDIGHTTGDTGGDGYARFIRAGTIVGQITSNGTTQVSYATSSDYRLKEDIVSMTGALETVAQLKPVTYKWKFDGSDGQGFIAHELQEVVPDCVTGEKDAVDAEGNPVYQGIDTSFLVATLTAAIQEQQAIITDLKARIEVLENSNGID